MRKYRTLVVLRERRDAVEASGEEWSDEEGAARRGEFRRLAEEFPGALRELELPAAVLAARAGAVAEELAAVESGREVSRAWVRVVLGYHALLVEILAAKGWLARRIGPRGAITVEILEEMAAFVGREISREEAETLHHPPGGRVVELVWRELEAREGMTREVLRQLIFSAHKL